MNKSFGPWSTAINTGAPQQLDTFWKRRLAMLPSLNQSKSRATRRTLLFLGVVAACALALPTLKWTAQMQLGGLARVLADDKPQPAEAGKGLAGADRRDRPGTGTKRAGAAPEIEYLPRPSKFEEQLLAALDKPVNVEFLDLALEDAIAFLQEAATLNIWLDKQTLTDEGVALDQPITLKLQGARLESVLNLILKPVQLTYLAEDDVLMITTATKAGEKLITRTYPVRDLYQGRIEVNDEPPAQKEGAGQKDAPGQKAGPAQKTEKAAASNVRGGGGFFDVDIEVAQGFGGGGGARGGQAGGGNGPAAGAAKPQAAPKRYADLVDAIVNTIEPDSWEELSGPGTYTYVKETGCLVIRQTWAIHRQILQLLRDLREGKKLSAAERGRNEE
jgi:hypothetical protein